MRLTFKTHESLQRVGADYVKIHFDLNEQVKLEHRFDVGQDQTHVWTIDEQLFKTIDKKDLNIAIKKTTLFLFKSEIESKKIKMTELSAKCEQTKDVVFNNKSQLQLTMSIKQPLKGKEYQEVPSKKLVIDAFMEPFKSLENQKE